MVRCAFGRWFWESIPLEKTNSKTPLKVILGRHLAFPFESFPSLFSVDIPSFSGGYLQVCFHRKTPWLNPLKAKQNSVDQIGDGCPTSPAESFQNILGGCFVRPYLGTGVHMPPYWGAWICRGVTLEWSSLKSPFLLRVSQEILIMKSHLKWEAILNQPRFYGKISPVVLDLNGD